MIPDSSLVDGIAGDALVVNHYRKRLEKRHSILLAVLIDSKDKP